MFDEHVEFLETALVEQKIDPLPCGQLAARMLRRDALLAAAEPCARAPFFKGVQNVFHVFVPSPILQLVRFLTGLCRRETPSKAYLGPFGRLIGSHLAAPRRARKIRRLRRGRGE